MKSSKASLRNFNMGKHFIFTQSAKITDFVSEDFEDDSKWHEKARQLQIRRWRKIRQIEGF